MHDSRFIFGVYNGSDRIIEFKSVTDKQIEYEFYIFIDS
jgi:hypothetical protein